MNVWTKERPMNLKYVSGLVVATLGLAVFTQGCEQINQVQGAVCCKEYQPADMLAVKWTITDPQARANFAAFAQAAGDLQLLASATVTDLGISCRNIAVDLGATAAELQGPDQAASPEASADGWCSLAAAKITAALPANFSVKAEAPSCEIDVQAKARCQASCSVSASCDIKTTPVKCEGGRLEVSCKGSCGVTATAPKIFCAGKCEAKCQGTCRATVQAPSVNCNGRCNGTCAAGGEANGTGIQADGTCNGTCTGTCVAKPGAAELTCAGSCEGDCSGSCTVEPGRASVRCDGECKTDFEPLKCTGGTLSGGCKVEAKCDANCEASVSARAQCTPGRLEITGGAQLAALARTLDANLPTILEILNGRAKQFEKLTGTFAGSVEGFLNSDAKAYAGVSGCVATIPDSIRRSTTQLATALSASGKVAGAIKVGKL
jgi:hypothetical protein